MWLVDCTGLALRLFQQQRRWNRRMINEDAKISHTFRAKREAPGRTGEPNSSAPDTAYAVQAAIFRLAPVPHARSTLLIPPGDLLVVHGPSLPPPALRECCHRGLARRLVAVRRPAVLVLAKGERPQPWLADRRGSRLHDPADDDAIADHVEVVVVPLAGRTGGRGPLEGQIVLVHFTEPTCAASLDHLVGAGEQHRRNVEAERPGPFAG